MSRSSGASRTCSDVGGNYRQARVADWVRASIFDESIPSDDSDRRSDSSRSWRHVQDDADPILARITATLADSSLLRRRLRAVGDVGTPGFRPVLPKIFPDSLLGRPRFSRVHGPPDGYEDADPADVDFPDPFDQEQEEEEVLRADVGGVPPSAFDVEADGLPKMCEEDEVGGGGEEEILRSEPPRDDPRYRNMVSPPPPVQDTWNPLEFFAPPYSSTCADTAEDAAAPGGCSLLEGRNAPPQTEVFTPFSFDVYEFLERKSDEAAGVVIEGVGELARRHPWLSRILVRYVDDEYGVRLDPDREETRVSFDRRRRGSQRRLLDVHAFCDDLALRFRLWKTVVRDRSPVRVTLTFVVDDYLSLAVREETTTTGEETSSVLRDSGTSSADVTAVTPLQTREDEFVEDPLSSARRRSRSGSGGRSSRSPSLPRLSWRSRGSYEEKMTSNLFPIAEDDEEGVPEDETRRREDQLPTLPEISAEESGTTSGGEDGEGAEVEDDAGRRGTPLSERHDAAGGEGGWEKKEEVREREPEESGDDDDDDDDWEDSPINELYVDKEEEEEQDGRQAENPPSPVPELPVDAERRPVPENSSDSPNTNKRDGKETGPTSAQCEVERDGEEMKISRGFPPSLSLSSSSSSSSNRGGTSAANGNKFADENSLTEICLSGIWPEGSGEESVSKEAKKRSAPENRRVVGRSKRGRRGKK